ncbi:MAG: hybrid sensor histidine kinase/response regulator [Fibrobacterota bacterium]
MGQINLLQSTVALLPDAHSMMKFTAAGLEKVPGIDDVSWELTDFPSRDNAGASLADRPEWKVYRIFRHEYHHGNFYIRVVDSEALSPYQPFLQNYFNMLGVILEEKRQRRLKDALNEELEQRVHARTAELKEREENLRITLNSIGDGVITTNTHGLISNMNPVAARLTGWALRDALGRPLEEVFRIIHASSRHTIDNPVTAVLKTGKIVGLGNHTILQSRTGAEYQIADSAAPIKSPDGDVSGVVLVFRNVTEEYALQEQLEQSMKMRAIGQLAAGVAHDFNNMLGGIIGAADMLKDETAPDTETQQFLDIILTSASRASDLTQKLLAFGRRGRFFNKIFNLHDVIRETVMLLERTVDKRVHISAYPRAGKSNIAGDSTQIQNALINMGLNAAHAMPAGGDLTLKTFDVYLDDAYCSRSIFDISPGSYIALEVSDTGHGISDKYVSKVFEPFFTTKNVGEGTGLGLSAAFGTVEEHGGEIFLKKSTSQGTVFQIHLPVVEGDVSTESVSEKQHHDGTGRTVLLIDDEPGIRTTVKAMLSDAGYTVVTAENGRSGVSVYRQNCNRIDVVLLDMIMPDQNGTDTFFELKYITPDVPVLLISGYSDNPDIQAMEECGSTGFLKKPFSKKCLYRALESVFR